MRVHGLASSGQHYQRSRNRCHRHSHRRGIAGNVSHVLQPGHGLSEYKDTQIETVMRKAAVVRLEKDAETPGRPKG